MYDVSNLDDGQLVATLTLDGDLLDARLVGTQVRVVTASAPTWTLGRPSTPQMARSLRPKDELRAAVARTVLDG